MRVDNVMWRWPPAVRARLVTAALVVGVLGVEAPEVLTAAPDRTTAVALAAAFGALAVAAGSLVLRRRWPVVVLAVTIVADEAVRAVVALPPDLPHGLAVIAAIYACGRYLPVWAAWLVGAVAGALAALAENERPDSSWLSGLAFVLLVILAGQYVRGWRYVTERRRAEAAEQAVRTERQRIARELHDVVAHHITVVNVLVGAARTAMAHDPDGAREVLTTAERTAREAMAEMRQLLSVLRAEGTDDADPGAYVGVAHLPALLRRTRAAGLPVDLEVVGTRRDLPAVVDLTVYRVVQEALTNTRRHAGPARALVRLRYEPAAVSVEVVDDGGGTAQQPAGAGSPAHRGYGLGGMAERVALCGGRVQAGPRDGGGFRVYASLPAPDTGPEPDPRHPGNAPPAPDGQTADAAASASADSPAAVEPTP